MKTILLAAGAAAIAFSAGPTLAAAKHSAVAAGPKQPIPYAELDSYLKASPKQRATKDWWSGQAVASTGASTGAAANTSATSTAGADVRSTPDATSATSSSGATAPSTTSEAAPALPATPPVDTPAPGSTASPSTTTPPGAAPSSTPPK